MRFTIRDLLWLTLLAAVLVAWWVDRRAQTRRIDELERAAAANLTYWSDLSYFQAHAQSGGSAVRIGQSVSVSTDKNPAHVPLTIRELLWLTVVVALGVAWWVDRGRLAREVAFLSNPYRESVIMTRDVALPLPKK